MNPKDKPYGDKWRQEMMKLSKDELIDLLIPTGPFPTWLYSEQHFRVQILRKWDRAKVVKFAKHLLGDKCQICREV